MRRGRDYLALHLVGLCACHATKIPVGLLNSDASASAQMTSRLPRLDVLKTGNASFAIGGVMMHCGIRPVLGCALPGTALDFAGARARAAANGPYILSLPARPTNAQHPPASQVEGAA